MWSRAEGMWLLFDLGEWDEIVATTEPLRRWADEHGDVQVGTVARHVPARVSSRIGATRSEAAEAIAEALPAARRDRGPPGAGSGAARRRRSPPALTATRPRRSAQAQEYRRRSRRAGPSEYRELQLPEAVRVAHRRRSIDLAGASVDVSAGARTPQDAERSVRMSRALARRPDGRFDEALLDLPEPSRSSVGAMGDAARARPTRSGRGTVLARARSVRGRRGGRGRGERLVLRSARRSRGDRPRHDNAALVGKRWWR